MSDLSDDRDDDELVPLEAALSHPLGGTSLANWMALLREHGEVAPECRGRAGIITLYTFVNWLSRLRMSLFDGPRIRRTPIVYPPVFIVGHWRSGTTFLHDIMSRDPALAAPMLYQTLAPRAFMALARLGPLYRRLLPPTRPMDNVALTFEGATEDEMALAAMGRLSIMHCMYFPQAAARLFRRHVLLEGLTDAERQRFIDDLMWFYRAVTDASGGKRLIIKNPSHTARIPLLLELFPGARFIHLYRNPYDVYASTVHMQVKLAARLGLQRITRHELKRQTLRAYPELMQRWFDDKHLIPPGNLVEVRYEDLERDAPGTMRRIYEKLNLPGYGEAEPHFRGYLDSLREYRKNEHRLTQEEINRVAEAWSLTIERWHYPPPSLTARDVQSVSA